MRRRLTSAVAIVLSASLAGCSSIGGKAAGGGKDTIPAAAAPSAVVVLKSCPIATSLGAEVAPVLPLLGVVAGAVIPEIVSAGVDIVAEFLEERARQLNASSTASAHGTFYRRKDESDAVALAFGCIVLVRGEFAGVPPKGIDSTWAGQLEEFNNAVVEAVAADSDSKLYLAGEPEFYAEFDVVPETTTFRKKSNGKEIELTTSFGLKPSYIYYTQSGAKRNPSGKKQLAVEISIESRSMFQDAKKDGSLYAQTFDLGFIEIGSERTPEDLRHKPAKLSSVPAFEQRELSYGGTEYVADELYPMTVTMTLTELEEGGDIERALAKALRDNKKKLSDPLVGYIDERIKALGDDK